MAFELYNESGNRLLGCSATLYGKHTAAVTGEMDPITHMPSVIVPAGASAGVLAFTAAGLQLTFMPYTRVANISGLNTGTEGAVTFGWWVRWEDNSGETSVFGADYVEYTSDAATCGITVTMTGSRKRYVELKNPDSLPFEDMWGLRPEELSYLQQSVQDVVEVYEVVVNLGGHVNTFHWVPNVDPCATDISINFGANPPAFGIIDHVFADDLSEESFAPDYTGAFFEAIGTVDQVWVEGTYWRSPGNPCSAVRHYGHRATVPAASFGGAWPLYDTVYNAECTMGNGAFSCAGGADVFPFAGWSMAYRCGGVIHDYIGAYGTDALALDAKNMDGVPRSATVRTRERHPRRVANPIDPTGIPGFNWDNSDVFNYNGHACTTGDPYDNPGYEFHDEDYQGLGSGGLTPGYAGVCDFSAWDSEPNGWRPWAHEMFIDINDDFSGSPGQVLHHGFDAEQFVIENVAPDWNQHRLTTNLAADVTAMDTSIALSSVAGIPDQGVAAIDGIGEVQYGGVDRAGKQLLNCYGVWYPGPAGAAVVINYGEWVEGSMKEPASPPWLPLPMQRTDPDSGLPAWDTETGKPLYETTDPSGIPRYDNMPLCDGGLETLDALILTLTPPGELVPDPPLSFGDTGLNWSGTNCGASADGTHLQIVTDDDISGAVADAADVFAQNVQLRGARMLRIIWSADVANAEAVVHLGKCTWTLKAGAAGAQTTEIDVACPETCETTGNMQSLVTYERPEDKSTWVDGGPARREGSEYYWDFPAGNGLGRLTELKIEPKTPNCTYTFTTAQFRRLSEEEGGFAKLYVIPHAGPWNQTRSFDDVAWLGSGVKMTSASDSHRVAIIPKAILIIDGLPVMEIPQSVVYEHEEEDTNGHSPWYQYQHVMLSPACAYPLKDYSSSTPELAVNGVDISTGLYNSPWWDSHCLTAFLYGGVYAQQSDNTIKVSLRVMPNQWSVRPDLDFFPTAAYKRWRGQVFGLLLVGAKAADRGGVTISTPDASPGAQQIDSETTDDNGFFTSIALNTKGDAEVESYGRGSAAVALASRLYSRCVLASSSIPPTGLALRYCASNGKIVLTPGGKPALTCCE